MHIYLRVKAASTYQTNAGLPGPCLYPTFALGTFAERGRWPPFMNIPGFFVLIRLFAGWRLRLRTISHCLLPRTRARCWRRQTAPWTHTHHHPPLPHLPGKNSAARTAPCARCAYGDALPPLPVQPPALPVPTTSPAPAFLYLPPHPTRTHTLHTPRAAHTGMAGTLPRGRQRGLHRAFRKRARAHTRGHRPFLCLQNVCSFSARARRRQMFGSLWDQTPVALTFHTPPNRINWLVA